MNDLKTRGVSDVLIAVVDGLKGFPAAVTAVFPDCVVQTCIQQTEIKIRQHALESACFVVCATAWLNPDQQALIAKDTGGSIGPISGRLLHGDRGARWNSDARASWLWRRCGHRGSQLPPDR